MLAGKAGLDKPIFSSVHRQNYSMIENHYENNNLVVELDNEKALKSKDGGVSGRYRPGVGISLDLENLSRRSCENL